MQTEYAFTLPRGYVDAEGQVHREGTMRLATALDEIEPLQDQRVISNEAYLTVILLSRVITRLGTLPAVTTEVVEKLFTGDLAYLQDLYESLNMGTEEVIEVSCPFCGKSFRVEAGEG